MPNHGLRLGRLTPPVKAVTVEQIRNGKMCGGKNGSKEDAV
jgi:hypothetical protein